MLINMGRKEVISVGFYFFYKVKIGYERNSEVLE